jgi:galactose mutarotase-like enzyme
MAASPTLSPVHLVAAGGASAAIVPRRGALITQWRAAGRDRLYLDESTLSDLAKNVRGGVPLLFPSPGKLADGRFTRDGKAGVMKQHGFARDVPWTVTAQTDSSLSLSLISSEETRAMFPWDFVLTLRVTLSELSLRLDLRVENTGTSSMPFGFGIHPYFPVRDKATATITTAATRAFDNTTGQVVPFEGFHLASGETDLHLLDHGSTGSILAADGDKLSIRTSPEFTRWVVWTLPDKGFVCLEPWTSPGNALNTGEGLIDLPPRATRDLWIELETV